MTGDQLSIGDRYAMHRTLREGFFGRHRVRPEVELKYNAGRPVSVNATRPCKPALDTM